VCKTFSITFSRSLKVEKAVSNDALPQGIFPVESIDDGMPPDFSLLNAVLNARLTSFNSCEFYGVNY
jgi:hypothetical protein